MDARTVAEVAEVSVGTLNVWVQRGLIPGMSTGARGRQREFDDNAALDVVVIATLVRLGWSAPLASRITRQWGAQDYLLVANPYPKILSGMAVDLNRIELEIIGFQSQTDLPNALSSFPGGEPSVYVVINIKELRERVKSDLYTRLQWEKAGRPVNAMRAFISPSPELSPPKRQRKRRARSAPKAHD